MNNQLYQLIDDEFVKVYTLAQISEEYSIPFPTLTSRIKSGKLAAVKIANAWFVTKKAVEASNFDGRKGGWTRKKKR